MRRKEDADCYVGNKFQDPIEHEENCPCTDEDYEWCVCLLVWLLRLCSDVRYIATITSSARALLVYPVDLNLYLPTSVSIPKTSTWGLLGTDSFPAILAIGIGESRKTIQSVKIVPKVRRRAILLR